MGAVDSLSLAAGNLRGEQLCLVHHVQTLQAFGHFSVSRFVSLLHLLCGHHQIAEHCAVFEERITVRKHADHSRFAGSQRKHHPIHRGVLAHGCEEEGAAGAYSIFLVEHNHLRRRSFLGEIRESLALLNKLLQ